MSALVRLALIVALVCTSGLATSQTIYRCGQTYSHAPCANGKAIEVDERSTAAQRAEGRQVAQSEKRLADGMARDRRLAEAAHQPALATSLGPARVAAATATTKAPAKKPSRKKHKDAQPEAGRDFVAAVPRVRKPAN
ncbi:MAG: hypothetical protein ABIZ18_07025 [Caldimonas sp.]